MTAADPATPIYADDAARPDVFDTIVVGAGLSGVCAAWHLTRARPDDRLAIIEARDNIGGTWDLFRYPGIRSDSDMPTLGFRFRPWLGEKAIADGPSIRRYIQDTADEAGITDRIRFGHKLISADWDSASAHIRSSGPPISSWPASASQSSAAARPR